MGLLPCPFCGCAVEVVRDHTNEGTDWIRHTEAHEPCGLDQFSNFTERLPVDELWNRRARPAA